MSLAPSRRAGATEACPRCQASDSVRTDIINEQTEATI